MSLQHEPACCIPALSGRRCKGNRRHGRPQTTASHTHGAGGRPPPIVDPDRHEPLERDGCRVTRSAVQRSACRNRYVRGRSVLQTVSKKRYLSYLRKSVMNYVAAHLHRRFLTNRSPPAPPKIATHVVVIVTSGIQRWRKGQSKRVSNARTAMARAAYFLLTMAVTWRLRCSSSLRFSRRNLLNRPQRIPQPCVDR